MPMFTQKPWWLLYLEAVLPSGALPPSSMQGVRLWPHCADVSAFVAILCYCNGRKVHSDLLLNGACLFLCLA